MSFPGGNHMVSMSCLNCSLQLAWKLHILLFPCCFHVISMVSIWTPHGFKCGHHVVSNVDTMCFPCRHHVMSRKKHGNQHKKQLCLKPTGFLVLFAPDNLLDIISCTSGSKSYHYVGLIDKGYFGKKSRSEEFH